jgi:hypothetical protein
MKILYHRELQIVVDHPIFQNVFGAYVLTQFAKHFIFLRLVGNPWEERAGITII